MNLWKTEKLIALTDSFPLLSQKLEENKIEGFISSHVKRLQV